MEGCNANDEQVGDDEVRRIAPVLVFKSSVAHFIATSVNVL